MTIYSKHHTLRKNSCNLQFLESQMDFFFIKKMKLIIPLSNIQTNPLIDGANIFSHKPHLDTGEVEPMLTIQHDKLMSPSIFFM